MLPPPLSPANFDHTMPATPRSQCAHARKAVEPDEFCEPLERVTIGDETLDLNPCGLIANSMFNGEGNERGRGVGLAGTKGGRAFPRACCTMTAVVARSLFGG